MARNYFFFQVYSSCNRSFSSIVGVFLRFRITILHVVLVQVQRSYIIVLWEIQ